MFAPLYGSIIGRAVNAGKLNIEVVNIRSFAENKHLKCDDYPFGGGAGMVMMPQPICSAIKAVDPEHKARRIYLSPKGTVFTQDKAFGLLGFEHIILLCGHYEGIDQRVIDLYIDEEISIGDYVLTGGEYPQYTRPAVYEGVAVPEVLLSGNHAEIDKWRRRESARLTREKRPDLTEGKK